MTEISKVVSRNSIFVAILIAETNVCSIINGFIHIPMISVLLVLLLILSIFACNKNNIRVSSKVGIPYFALLLLLLLSTLIYGFDNAGSSLMFFVLFATCALCCVSVEYDLNRVQRYLIYIYAIHLIYYYTLGRNVFLDSDDYNIAQMGVAFSFLPAIIISCAYFLHHRLFKRNRKTDIIYLFVLVAGLNVVLFDCFTRGALLSIALGIMLLIVNKIPSKVRKLFLISIATIFYLIYAYIEEALNLIWIMGGHRIAAISKFRFKIENDDVSNGRDDLYSIAFNLISDNPIFGYGVGCFERITGGAYPHDIFLEMIIEVGAIGLVLFVLPFYKKFKRIQSPYNVENVFFISVFSLSVFPLLFSGSFWQLPAFWFCFFYTIISNRTNNIQVNSCNN